MGKVEVESESIEESEFSERLRSTSSGKPTSLKTCRFLILFWERFKILRRGNSAYWSPFKLVIWFLSVLCEKNTQGEKIQVWKICLTAERQLPNIIIAQVNLSQARCVYGRSWDHLL